MALYKLENIYPDYRDRLRNIGDVNGMNVYGGETNDKIGHVHDALLDETGRFRYLVIDTGAWISGKKILLPVGCCRFDEQHHRVLATGLRSRDQAQRLPSYHDDMVIDQRYEEQVRSIYHSTTARTATTSTVTSTTTSTVAPTNVPVLEAPVESPVPVEASIPVEEVVVVETARAAQQSIDSSSATIASVPYEQEPAVYEPPVASVPHEQESAVYYQPPVASVPYEQDPLLYKTTPDQHQLVKLYEERLIIDKTRHKTGEVVISKRVETERDRVSVPVEKTKIIIEISPVQQQVVRTGGTEVYHRSDHAPANYSQDTEIARFDLYEETVEARKQPIVRQEIVIRKEVVRDIVDIEDTVRREEIDIEREGDPRIDVLDRPQ